MRFKCDDKSTILLQKTKSVTRDDSKPVVNCNCLINIDHYCLYNDENTNEETVRTVLRTEQHYQYIAAEMLRHVILLFAVVYLTESLSIVNPGPQYPPTKGSIWPRPHQQTQTDSYYKLNPSTFVITVSLNIMYLHL